MKAILEDIPLYKLKTIITLVCIIGDIALFSYTFNSIRNPEYFNKVLELSLEVNKMKLPKEDRDSLHIPQEMAETLHSATIISTAILLVLLFLLHFTVHIFFHRDKKGPWHYLKLYSLLAVVGLFLTIGINNDSWRILMWVVLIFAYSFNSLVFLNVKYVPPRRQKK